MAENKLTDIIRSSLDGIKDLVDVNTVIGDPITTESGTTIIPVSKIAVGYLSGGVDYFSKKVTDPKQQNFGGGGGTGLSVSPVGFLVVTSDGKVELLNMNSPTGKPDAIESISNLIEKSPAIVDKFKQVFNKEKSVEDQIEEQIEAE
jgi:Uncharacterized conserved protein